MDKDDETQNLKTMPVRDYLNLELMPILLEGMKMVERKRPSDPVAMLGKYLTDYAARQEKKQANAAAKKEEQKQSQNEQHQQQQQHDMQIDAAEP